MEYPILYGAQTHLYVNIGKTQKQILLIKSDAYAILHPMIYVLEKKSSKAPL